MTQIYSAEIEEWVLACVTLIPEESIDLPLIFSDIMPQPIWEASV